MFKAELQTLNRKAETFVSAFCLEQFGVIDLVALELELEHLGRSLEDKIPLF